MTGRNFNDGRTDRIELGPKDWVHPGLDVEQAYRMVFGRMTWLFRVTPLALYHDGERVPMAAFPNECEVIIETSPEPMALGLRLYHAWGMVQRITGEIGEHV